jgi:hypothetical protein
VLFSSLCVATAMVGAGYYSVDGSRYARKRVKLPARS